jgi:hypothetical protein
MRPRRPAIRQLRLVVPVLVATLAVVGVAVSPGTASAHDGHQGAAQVTFTKWVVTQPANPPSFVGVLMTGVVGGSVGDGQYVGTVLSDDLSEPGFWHARALYGFFGHQHALIASLQITENDTTSPATAVLTGVVVAGWHHNERIRGGYTVMDPCPIPTPGNVAGSVCFQGSLTIGPARSR